MEINLEEIYQILDSARQQPMSEAHYEKVKTAVAALAERAAPRPRTTERTDAALRDQNPGAPAGKEPAAKGKSAKPRTPGLTINKPPAFGCILSASSSSPMLAEVT